MPDPLPKIRKIFNGAESKQCYAEGMTEIPIGPTTPDIYLTPRAAETALAAGIVAVRPNIEGIHAVRDYVNERFTAPEYRFPEEVNELTFLMRWSGKGNKLMWQWDTIYDRAKPNDRWINGWALTVNEVDAARLGDERPHTVFKRDLDPAKTVEIHIDDWENPDFASKFAQGVLFKHHGRSQKSLYDNLVRDVYEALDTESVTRHKFGKQAGGQIPKDPAVITTPFTLLHKEPRL